MSYNEAGDANTGNNIQNFSKNVLPAILHYTTDKNWALDMGCGNGRMSKILSKSFTNIVSIDQCNIFDNRFGSKNIKFDNISFENFQTEHKFDLILMWGVFYMVQNHMQVLIKCKEILSSKGIVVIGDNVKRRIDRNPGNEDACYSISKLCKQTGFKEEIDFNTFLRVTILSKGNLDINKPYIKSKNWKSSKVSKKRK